jgi:hypothetical protein
MGSSEINIADITKEGKRPGARDRAEALAYIEKLRAEAERDLGERAMGIVSEHGIVLTRHDVEENARLRRESGGKGTDDKIPYSDNG